MRKVVKFPIDETLPEVAGVLHRQGFPEGVAPSARVRQLFHSALELYLALATPRGVFDEVDRADFASVHSGKGHNAPESPLAQIVPAAGSFALFAATTGHSVSSRPDELFQRGDLALAVMLDAVVSEAADRLAGLLADQYTDLLNKEGRAPGDTRVLHYAPGYCGWHVSGQAALFARLRPQEIGMTLGESFLMQPLKSVSGVLIAAPARVHCFRPKFPFCVECKERECLDRMAFAIRGQQPS